MKKLLLLLLPLIAVADNSVPDVQCLPAKPECKEYNVIWNSGINDVGYIYIKYFDTYRLPGMSTPWKMLERVSDFSSGGPLYVAISNRASRGVCVIAETKNPPYGYEPVSIVIEPTWDNCILHECH